MSNNLVTLLGVIAVLTGPALAAPPPNSLPDLVVAEVKFDHVNSYQNAQGRTCYNFQTSYTIKNQGHATAAGTGANMEVTAQNTGQYMFFSSVQGSGTLAPGASITVPSQPASAQNWCFDSPHRAKVRIIIDPPDGPHPRGNVTESNEDNNAREREFQPVMKPKAPVPIQP